MNKRTLAYVIALMASSMTLGLEIGGKESIWSIGGSVVLIASILLSFSSELRDSKASTNPQNP